MRYNDFETMSIYTVENFTSDITVEGYIAEFRDEPHFLELCKQCTNYGKSWGCPPSDSERFCNFLFILVSFRMDITTSAFYTIFWFEQVHTGSGYMSY